MNTENITLYELETNDYGSTYNIKKRIVKVSKNDIVKKDKGYIKITLVDSWQNGHNGDFEDEDIYGFETYELAKNEYIKKLENKILDYKRLIIKIENMKERMQYE